MSIPGGASSAGASNSPQAGIGQDPSGNDGSGGLRVEVDRLARLLDPAAFDDSIERVTVGDQWRRVEALRAARLHAEAALRAGYRRVVEDDTTVDRVAAALAAADSAAGTGLALTYEERWEMARQAIRGIRDGGQ